MQKKELSLISGKKEVLFKGRIIELTLKEELIINKSIEFFNDPAPCFIHRSAVMKRLFMELENYFEKTEREKLCACDWEALPMNIKQILSCYDGVTYVEYD